MPANRSPEGNRPRPSLIHNWISLAGIILAACSLFAFACLFLIDFFRTVKNPYLGILTYLVAPAFLLLGLLLSAGGALWERHRCRRLAPGQVPEFPRIDLNVPRQRHTLIVVAVVTFALLLLTALGSYRTCAIAAVQSIYSHNFFPGMKVDWRVYPDNVGHLYFPGCYRCHDGRHVAADGATITHNCQACHLIVAQGTGAAPSTLSMEGLAFKHPEDIGGMWQSFNCSFCHTGALAD